VRKTTLALLGALSLGLFGAAASAQEVQSLRGDLAIDDPDHAPATFRQETGGPMERAYRQQPPLIPHRISGYQIDLRVNKCLSCHDWPANVKEGAPKVSETHYTDREGVALDKVAGTRWFCTQCHVPQANAPSLVSNTFTNANETR
jgi:cytochrome c-type protein NapB